MKKKIGCVIAFRPGHNNYGTSLVGYALIRKIGQLGHEVEVINYQKRLSTGEKLRFLWNALRCGMMKSLWQRLEVKRVMKRHPNYAEGIRTRTRAVDQYKAEKLLPLFRDYVGYEALHEGSRGYDVVVVGSDQVWTPMSLPNRYFNLLFVADEVRRVAYGSSFGVSEIPAFQRKATGRYLDRFSAIGVREQRGKEIVDELSQKTATVVADPTMLLSAHDWEEEAKGSSFGGGEPYIFVYLLGTNQEAREAARKLKEQTGLRIIAIRHMDEYVAQDETFGDEAPYDVGPNDFVRLISRARYVLTDSFHCSAFSIQFHRQFMTFYRFRQGQAGGRNSRIDSLFNVLGISRSRIYQGDIGPIDEAVDWEAVDERLGRLREESTLFLRHALE